MSILGNGGKIFVKKKKAHAFNEVLQVNKK